MNNNDRLNAMSVEEKAKFLKGVASCICDVCTKDEECYCLGGEFCIEGIKQWLEAKSEG